MIPQIKVARIDRMTLSEIEAKGLSHLIDTGRKIKRKPGRPRVIPDRRFQFSMSYWYGLIAADYHQLSKVQRVRVALECWKALLGRMKSLPSDPAESKLNADEAMRMLGKLESKGAETAVPESSSLREAESESASIAQVGLGSDLAPIETRLTIDERELNTVTDATTAVNNDIKD